MGWSDQPLEQVNAEHTEERENGRGDSRDIYVRYINSLRVSLLMKILCAENIPSVDVGWAGGRVGRPLRRYQSNI